MKEFLDIVDEYGNPTGEVVERGVAHSEGVPHRTSHLWILRRKNGRTEVLLQKRAPVKSFPGCYDISSAGHIPAGGDFVTSAVRELKEELGVTADADDLVCCGDRVIYWDDVFFGKPYHDRQYTRVFLIWLDMDEEQFILQEEEVDSVLWMDLDQCIDGVRKGSFENCIAAEELMMVRKTALFDEVWAVEAGRIEDYFRETGGDAEVIKLPERRVGTLTIPQTRIIISGKDAEETHRRFLLRFASAGG